MPHTDRTSPDQINRKLAWSFGAVVLLLMLTATGVASHLFLRLQAEEEDRLAGAITAILSESISRVTFSGKHHARLLVEDMLARVPELAYIAVVTNDGRVLAHSNPAQNDSEVSGETAVLSRNSLQTNGPIHAEHSTPEGIVKEVIVPYRGGFDAGVAGTVHVGVRVETARNAQRANLLKLLVLVAALTAAAIAAVYILSRRFGGSMRVLGWQLQGILGHAPLGIAISDRAGSLLARSAEFERMIGPVHGNPSMAALLSRTIPEAACQTLAGMDRQVLDASRKIEQEMTVETGGAFRFWHVSKFPIASDTAGAVTLSCTLIHDITERKLAELSLRESEERYRGVFEGANDAIFIMDGPVWLECNDKAMTLFACQRSDIIGKTVEAFSPEDQPDGQSSALKARRLIEMVLAGEPQIFEWQHVTLNGRLIYTEVSLSAITAGDKPCIQAIVRDITQRREAEEQLRQSEEKFSKIFELAPDWISISRLSDNVVLSVNTVFETISGYSREELVGRSTADLNLWADPLERERFFKLLRDTGRIDNYDFKLRTKAGGIRHCSRSSQRITLYDEPCALSVVRDVTESFMMKEVMIQTEKMMSIGGLAAGMAHEINNPLGGILQSIQVIQNRLSIESPANVLAADKSGCSFAAISRFVENREILSLLQGVRDAGARAARIVSNMLEFSRKHASTKAPQEMSHVLDKAVELCANDYDLKKKYDFRRISIEREYDPSLPPVPCASTQIEQVLMNLLRNAAQAMTGRPADAPAPRIILRTRREGTMARIEVEDNGPGMDETMRRKIFEPFYTTKAPGEGTGLGLSVSYFIITSAHNGTIHVESTPGAGSTFIIRLPLEPTSPAAFCQTAL